MKTTPASLPLEYRQALHRHLRPGAPALAPGLKRARSLGRQAFAGGWQILELVQLHEDALAELPPPLVADHTHPSRAAAFLSQALGPIGAYQRGIQDLNARLSDHLTTLKQRSKELASKNVQLNREIVHRMDVEKSLRLSELTASQLLAQSSHMQEELRRLSRRLLTVQEEERKRISRELHDVIGQTLTGINFRLAALKSQTAAHGRDLHKKIAVTQRLVEKSVKQVHQFATDLRPTALDDLGIIPALHSHIIAFMAQTGIRVELHATPAVEKWDSAIRTVLYRIVQESLSNVARHSHASVVKIDLFQQKSVLHLTIGDNGRGFAVSNPKSSTGRTHLGLLGMRERVEMVGGTFCVESQPDSPTNVRVEIPTPVSRRRTPSSGTTSLECP